MNSSIVPIGSHALSAWIKFIVDGSQVPILDIKAHGANHEELKADAMSQINVLLSRKLVDTLTAYTNVKVCGMVPPDNSEFCLLVLFSGTLHDIVEAAEPQLEVIFQQAIKLAKELARQAAETGDSQRETLLDKAIHQDPSRRTLLERALVHAVRVESRTQRRRASRG